MRNLRRWNAGMYALAGLVVAASWLAVIGVAAGLAWLVLLIAGS